MVSLSNELSSIVIVPLVYNVVACDGTMTVYANVIEPLICVGVEEESALSECEHLKRARVLISYQRGGQLHTHGLPDTGPPATGKVQRKNAI